MTDQISVTRSVPASPQQLFELLSNPARHQEIDGADMLRGIDGSEILTGVGDEFVMNMHNGALGDYQMKNTVTAFEPGRLIGWAPSLHPMDGYRDKLGEVRAEGHSYTWHLEPDGSGTRVTQVYDWSEVTDDDFRGFFPMLSEQQLGDSIEKAGNAATS
ncbi:SRPBCC family protein [Pseudonocardia nematodicida]|uniref:SRPBCC family protein n=1 Tax=Pseudonocardia nematodicida TaxID=1206997 RepID=A0ABV1K6W8_9PSEU